MLFGTPSPRRPSSSATAPEPVIGSVGLPTDPITGSQAGRGWGPGWWGRGFAYPVLRTARPIVRTVLRMMRSGRTSLAGALVVAAVALTSCVGIGAVNRGAVVRQAQQRGGGITTGLVDEALAAVAERTGEDPVAVHSITATLAQVVVVVPATDGSGGRESWTYGTSGQLGGKGLEGPTPVAEPAFETFPVAVGDLDVDAHVVTARDAVGPGRWVESYAVARPAAGAEPVTTVVVTDGVDVPSPVVLDADGAIVVEGVR